MFPLEKRLFCRKKTPSKRRARANCWVLSKQNSKSNLNETVRSVSETFMITRSSFHFRARCVHCIWRPPLQHIRWTHLQLPGHVSVRSDQGLYISKRLYCLGKEWRSKNTLLLLDQVGGAAYDGDDREPSPALNSATEWHTCRPAFPQHRRTHRPRWIPAETHHHHR